MDNTDPSPKTTPSPEPDAGASALETPEPSGSNDQTPEKKPKSGGLKEFIKKFNIYVVLFIFILVIAGVITTVAYFQNKKAATSTIKSQNLSSSTLQQLANSDATVGSNQEVLNVESNAVFAGKVLVRNSLEVAGGLQVSGNVDFQSITVSGDTNLQDADVAKSLTVGSTLAVQGSATFNQGIQVNGSGTFSGAISTPELTTPSFQLNGDLVLTHHVTAGGATPSSSRGTAVGSGGTATLSGSDTAGEVSINTGGGPAAGCFISISFALAYNQTPYVIVTPVDSGAGGLQYYVTRNDSGFSICTDSAAPASSSFGFDYFVVD